MCIHFGPIILVSVDPGWAFCIWLLYHFQHLHKKLPHTVLIIFKYYQLSSYFNYNHHQSEKLSEAMHVIGSLTQIPLSYKLSFEARKWIRDICLKTIRYDYTTFQKIGCKYMTIPVSYSFHAHTHNPWWYTRFFPVRA